MPRYKPRDPRRAYASLIRFIEADLNAENWNALVLSASRFNVRQRPPRPDEKGPRVLRPRGAARYHRVELDVPDLAAARAIQARYRVEWEAVQKGDDGPVRTSSPGVFNAAVSGSPHPPSPKFQRRSRVSPWSSWSKRTDGLAASAYRLIGTARRSRARCCRGVGDVIMSNAGMVLSLG